MTFTLAGFNDGSGSRRFLFRCTRADHSFTTVMVRADLALARKHEIRLQELPLICVRLLETLPEDALAAPVTLTEDHMIGIQKTAREAAEQKMLKAPPRRPRNPSAAGDGQWRAS